MKPIQRQTLAVAAEAMEEEVKELCIEKKEVEAELSDLGKTCLALRGKIEHCKYGARRIRMFLEDRPSTNPAYTYRKE